MDGLLGAFPHSLPRTSKKTASGSTMVGGGWQSLSLCHGKHIQGPCSLNHAKVSLPVEGSGNLSPALR